MQRNAHQWLSIAKFVETDPLIALGLQGGWARSMSNEKRTQPGAARSEARTAQGFVRSEGESGLSIPLGNHGDNNL